MHRLPATWPPDRYQGWTSTSEQMMAFRTHHALLGGVYLFEDNVGNQLLPLKCRFDHCMTLYRTVSMPVFGSYTFPVIYHFVFVE
jgi:hypothetical protein